MKRFALPFLYLLLIALCGGCTCSGSAAYSVLLFGDTHYDSESVRTEGSIDKLSDSQKKELPRNLKRWQNNMPTLLKNADKQSGKTAFAVQLGDLIQGDCGSEEKHRQSAEEALKMLTGHLHTKLYIVRGNHDTRGKGGQVWFKVMQPYLEQVTGQKFKPGIVHFTMMQEKDLFIFLDCNKPDVQFVRKAITDHPDARHVFLLTHFPLVPCTPYGIDWIIFGRPNKQDQRQELLKILAEKNAIVLCGHTHVPALFDYRFPEGRITQFTSFSLPSRLDQKYERITVFPFMDTAQSKNFQKAF